MEPLIVFDIKKCICCHSCEVACQLENEAPPGVQLRSVKSRVFGGFPASYPRSISSACFHCSDPSCASACPAGALPRRADGVVEHIRGKCIGCGYCILACPFDVPQFSPAQQTMRKCSFCVQRIDRGKEPACVATCPTDALAFFPDGRNVGEIAAYGENEHLRMIYQVEGRPADYSLPVPVPRNTTTSSQVWKWLIGLVPGGVLLAWLWKSVEQENGHE